MPIGFERIEKRERRVDVEVGDAEVRNGPSHTFRREAEPSFQASRYARIVCRLAPIRPGRCSLKNVARWWARSSADVIRVLRQVDHGPEAVVEAARSFRQQLRRGGQITLGGQKRAVAEIGRQERQLGLDVGAVAVPPQQAMDGKRVPIMPGPA